MSSPLLRLDLVILTDTSPTMKTDARAVSAAAEAALAAAQHPRPADIRVTWLGIEGRWRRTAFTQTARGYLTQTCQAPPSALRGRQRGELPGGGAQEDAARAMEDVAAYFDWRPEARRHLFYLGDEALDGGGDRPDAADEAAADRAIAAARSAGVRVHTHLGLTRSRHREALARDYARVAAATGGLAFAARPEAPTDFAAVLLAIVGHGQPDLPTDPPKETPMPEKDAPNAHPAPAAPRKSWLPTTQTGLQDYSYWWEYARKHAKSNAAKAKGKPFRRGRIWA